MSGAAGLSPQEAAGPPGPPIKAWPVCWGGLETGNRLPHRHLPPGEGAGYRPGSSGEPTASWRLPPRLGREAGREGGRQLFL